MLFEKNIEISSLEIGGIKCDTPFCNYSDDAVTLSQYPEYINKKCPACSGILLTEADSNLVNRIVKISKYINGVANFIIPNYFLRKMVPTKDDGVTMVMDMNGSGKVIEVKKEKYNG